MALLAGCQATGPDAEPATAAGDPTDGAVDEPVPAAGLPTVELSFDEEGPRDVAGAWAASDYVVLATIGDVVDGARFYGGDDAEDPGESAWTEDVELQLEVSDYLKGSGSERLAIRWPSYQTREASSATRTGVLDIGGVRRDLPRDGRYVFFLTDHGQPFGLTSVSTGASLLEVGPDLTIQGQVATVFEELHGQPLADALPMTLSSGPTDHRRSSSKRLPIEQP